MSIRMGLMYPDLLNLHGDKANVTAFERVASALEVPFETVRYDDPGAGINFSGLDLLLFPPGETVEAGYLAEVLADQKEGFAGYIEEGGIMAVIGTSLAVFARHTRRKRGDPFDGLGIIGAELTELRTAYSNDAVLITDSFGKEMEIVGGQIQMLKISRDEGTEPLGRAEYGYGNDGGGFEGIRVKNFIHTNFLGPVFVKNPWFAEELIRLACERRGVPVKGESPAYGLERRSNEEIRRFIRMKIEKYDKTRLYNGED